MKTEADVRRWLKNQAGAKVFWIEPGAGGSSGLPDAYVSHDFPFWLELKIARQLKDGRLRYQIRNTQKQLIRRLVKAGTAVGFLLGVKGSGSMYISEVNELSIAGTVDPTASDVYEILKGDTLCLNAVYRTIEGTRKFDVLAA